MVVLVEAQRYLGPRTDGAIAVSTPHDVFEARVSATVCGGGVGLRRRTLRVDDNRIGEAHGPGGHLITPVTSIWNQQIGRPLGCIAGHVHGAVGAAILRMARHRGDAPPFWALESKLIDRIP
jgi:hypothetical protein